MITLDPNDNNLIGKKYLIKYSANCPFTNKPYNDKAIAEIIDYAKFLMFWFDDSYGRESFAYLDEVEILEDIQNKSNKKYFKEREYQIRYASGKCSETGIETFNITTATLKRYDNQKFLKYNNDFGKEVFSKMNEVVILKELK